ncbi:MAG: PP2C family protein-serine/threonine phosphatase [Caldilineaceae bacterium]
MFYPHLYLTQSRWIEVPRAFMSACIDALRQWQAANRTRQVSTHEAWGQNKQLTLPQAIGGKLPVQTSSITTDHAPLQSHLNALKSELQTITSELLHSQELLFQANVERQMLNLALTTARDLQENLLPDGSPQVARLDIYACSKPAHEINGDFYDFIHSDQPSLTLTIGDVSGKGIAAGLLMTMTRKVLRTGQKVLLQTSPRSMLKYANRDLHEEFANTGTFATAFVGQFACESRLLQYANAGHSPVIYRAAAADAQLLPADSAPIGVLPECDVTNHQMHLWPGDILVVGSDGITDARNVAGEMFGLERLLNLINKHADESAPEIVNAIFRAVAAFEGGRSQDDDQTLVVLKGV